MNETIQAVKNARGNLLAQRQSGIGSTDAAVICGSYPWKTPLELFLEKIGEVDSDSDEKQDAEEDDGSDYNPMFWGTALESIVAKRFVDISGGSLVDTGSRFRRHKTRPWQICHLDRMYSDASGLRRILEVKTAGHWSHEHWEGQSSPPWYVVQVQHQMAVTGEAHATLACLIAGQRLVWRHHERDDEFIDHMTKIEKEFWERVENQDPPAALSGDIDSLSNRFPTCSIGKRVELPQEASEIFERSEELRNEMKPIRQEIENGKARIIQMMEDAELGILPNEAGAYTYRTVNRKEYAVKAASYRQLRHTAKT